MRGGYHNRSVAESGADLGIIFDTDVDRAGAVDRSGKELNRNRLIALLSALVLKDKSGVIVTDSVPSPAEYSSIYGFISKFPSPHKNSSFSAIDNGAGGFFAEKVLVPLGADITGSQFLGGYHNRSVAIAELVFNKHKHRRSGRKRSVNNVASA